MLVFFVLLRHLLRYDAVQCGGMQRRYARCETTRIDNELYATDASIHTHTRLLRKKKGPYPLGGSDETGW